MRDLIVCVLMGLADKVRRDHRPSELFATEYWLGGIKYGGPTIAADSWEEADAILEASCCPMWLIGTYTDKKLIAKLVAP